MPSAGTFWPVLPSVTTGSSPGAPHAEAAGARAAEPPAIAAVLRNSRRLPPIPSFRLPSIVAAFPQGGRFPACGGKSNAGIILTKPLADGQQGCNKTQIMQV